MSAKSTEAYAELLADVKSEKPSWKASISELSQLSIGISEDEDEPTAITTAKVDELVWPLSRFYLSQFLASWREKMWAFASGFLLIEITPKSLRLIATYEATLSLVAVFLASAVGRWIDRRRRIVAACATLTLQNVMLCLCIALLCCLVNYLNWFASSLSGWGETIAQVGVILLACLAQLGHIGYRLVIEKDWIIVLSGKSAAKLATMNSVLRTVDLSTDMIAPILVGFVITAVGTVIGGIVVIVCTVVIFVVEFLLLYHLYINTPTLRKQKQPPNIGNEENSWTKVKEVLLMWRKYFVHKLRFAGLGLALLYMTVIAFHNYSTAYVYENGVSTAVIGILKACASLSGILGALLFPIFRKFLGIVRTGVFGFSFEFCCLTLCVAAMFAPGTTFEPSAIFNREMAVSNMTLNSSLINFSHFELNNNISDWYSPDRRDRADYTSVSLLLAGIITSRLGLWIADLTVNQLLQQEVVESERGGINGVQVSLNQMFSLVRAGLLILLPSIATFGYLVILSYLSIAAGCVCFCVYAYKNMKNISDPTGEELKMGTRQ